MLQGVARIGALCALLTLALAMSARAADWQPISPEDLQLTREPKAPTASAIYLYRQIDRSDSKSEEAVYLRIKILTDEGRQYANVDIPYVQDAESIRDLQARTIRPDGTIIDFNGTVYDKPLIKARGFSGMSKSFTLSGVETGSIIEYRYRRLRTFNWVFSSQWLLNEDLFTRHAVFSLRPETRLMLRWSTPIGLPANTQGPTNEHGTIRLEARDVPAFVIEDFMPPPNALRFRVEFIYEVDDTDQKDEASYWKAFGKSLFKDLAWFARDEAALKREVDRLIASADSSETKARKIYARVQQIHNVSFERGLTEQEAQRDKRADNRNAIDLLKRGYGSADDINWLLYGLLRAANLESFVVMVSPRDTYLFNLHMMNAHELTRSVVLVNFEDSAAFLDAGTPFTPFGLLPWNATGISGLLLTASGGKWVPTSVPAPIESRVERKGTVKLTSSGSLEGKVTVTYSGLEAAWRRLAERNGDATERRQFLEQDLQAGVPVGIELKLTNAPDWTSAEPPLVAEFDIRVPGWLATAGSRALMPTGVFGGVEKHLFEYGARVHPLYFMFPYQHSDEVAIELPTGWRASAIPKPHTNDIKIAKYATDVQEAGGTLSLKRDLVLNTILVEQKFYDKMHDFYQDVRAGDDETIIVTPGLKGAP